MCDIADRSFFSDSAPVIDSFDGEWRWLSNFGEGTVLYEGIRYPTSEHAYQAAKTADVAERQAMAAVPTPGKAKKMGQLVTMSPDFEARKYEVMVDVLRAKFTQNQQLGEKLVATYPSKLVEGNHWHDNYWGDCNCAQCSVHPGSNMLGQALMQVRSELLDLQLEQEERLSFMSEAARLAEANVSSGDGGPFGAVIVKDGEIVGRGRNMVLVSHDSTAHAEVVAIRDAEKRLGTHDLSGCEIYTSCFPCPMCMGAIMWANIGKCYYGNTKEDAAAIDFRDDDFYDFISGVATGDGSLFSESSLELIPLGREDTIKAFEAYAEKGMLRY